MSTGKWDYKFANNVWIKWTFGSTYEAWRRFNKLTPKLMFERLKANAVAGRNDRKPNLSDLRNFQKAMREFGEDPQNLPDNVLVAKYTVSSIVAKGNNRAYVVKST